MQRLRQTKYGTGRAKDRFFSDRRGHNPLVPLIAFGIVFVLVASFIIAGLRAGYVLELDKVTITTEKLPKSFNGYKILQISDVYGREFGTEQKKIKKLLALEDYDIVIFTGDYFAEDEEDFWIIKDIMSCLKKDVPVYYILGDHDYTPANVSEKSDKWKMCITPAKKTEFMTFFEETYDAKFIYPAQKITNEAGDSIYLTGINYDKETMNEMDFDSDEDFSICVTHKPINYDVTRRLKDVNKRTITEIDYDVCLSGHTCGGLFKLPILGTVYDADEGWFPQEEDLQGLSTDSDGRFTYICGGLGCGSGFRFFSSPQISIIELCVPDDGVDIEK